jgi:hypothetical protein
MIVLVEESNSEDPRGATTSNYILERYNLTCNINNQNMVLGSHKIKLKRVDIKRFKANMIFIMWLVIFA